jgi:hypothetical protein
MKKNIDQIYSSLFTKHLEYSFFPSRRCPNCSIMINRDEGCNKVDCSLCGFSFCWGCGSSWSDVSVLLVCIKKSWFIHQHVFYFIFYRAVDSFIVQCWAIVRIVIQ